MTERGWRDAIPGVLLHSFAISSGMTRRLLHAVYVAIAASIGTLRMLSHEDAHEWETIGRALKWAFALTSCVENYAFYAAFGLHNAHVFFYVGWIYTAPAGALRTFMLTIVVVHAYFSAGVCKLTVGGAWSPEDCSCSSPAWRFCHKRAPCHFAASRCHL